MPELRIDLLEGKAAPEMLTCRTEGDEPKEEAKPAIKSKRMRPKLKSVELSLPKLVPRCGPEQELRTPDLPRIKALKRRTLTDHFSPVHSPAMQPIDEYRVSTKVFSSQSERRSGYGWTVRDSLAKREGGVTAERPKSLHFWELFNEDAEKEGGEDQRPRRFSQEDACRKPKKPVKGPCEIEPLVQKLRSLISELKRIPSKKAVVLTERRAKAQESQVYLETLNDEASIELEESPSLRRRFSQDSSPVQTYRSGMALASQKETRTVGIDTLDLEHPLEPVGFDTPRPVLQ